MNILIITEDTSTGGITQLVNNHVNYLLSKGHTIHWISPRPKKKIGKVWRHSHLEHYYFQARKTNFFRTYLELWRNLPGILERLLGEQQIDIALTHYPISLWIVLPILRRFQIPSVANFHGLEYLEMKKYKENQLEFSLREIKSRLLKFFIPLGLRFIEKRSYEQVDRIIFLSQYSIRLLSSLVNVDKKQKLIPGFFDPEVFRPLVVSKKSLRVKHKLPIDKFVVLHASRLEPRKGIGTFLETALLLRNNSQYLFLITYPDDANKSLYLPPIKRFLATHRLKNIKIIPNRPKQYIELLKATDLFFMSSLELETFGLVTLEALACNLPVISFPVCATPEILKHFDARLIISSVSARAAAKKIEEMTVYLKRHKFECRRKIRQLYSRDVVMRQYESFLLTMIGQQYLP